MINNIPLAEQRAHGKYPTLHKQDQTCEYRVGVTVLGTQAKHHFRYIQVCIRMMNHALGMAEAILGSDSSKGDCLYQSHGNMCIFSSLVA